MRKLVRFCGVKFDASEAVPVQGREYCSPGHFVYMLYVRLMQSTLRAKSEHQAVSGELVLSSCTSQVPGACEAQMSCRPRTHCILRGHMPACKSSSTLQALRLHKQVVTRTEHRKGKQHQDAFMRLC